MIKRLITPIRMIFASSLLLSTSVGSEKTLTILHSDMNPQEDITLRITRQEPTAPTHLPALYESKKKAQALLDQFFEPVGAFNPTFMTIDGEGSFITNSKADGTGDVEFTRVGNFEPDEDGNYVNGEGQYLQVLETDRTGNVPEEQRTSEYLVTATTPKPYLLSQASETIDISCVLPSKYKEKSGKNRKYNMFVPIYDHSGTAHLITFTWTAVKHHVWTLTASAPGGIIEAPYDKGVTVKLAPVKKDPTQKSTLFVPKRFVPSTGSKYKCAPSLGAIWTASGDWNLLTLNLDVRTIMGEAYTVNGPFSDGHSDSVYAATIMSPEGLISVKYENGVILPFGQIALASSDPEAPYYYPGTDPVGTIVQGTYQEDVD